MNEEKTNDVSSRIHNMLHYVSDKPFKPYIFRVDDLLRRANEKAYEPVMLAIGPYHHRKDNLKMMEEHIFRYLHQLLEQRNEQKVNKYVTKLSELEERARRCYAEPVRLEKDEFVEMMFLDGCFIIELFGKFRMNIELGIEDDDRIFKMDRMLKILQRDLLLFENQLPFFNLVELFNMTKLPDDPQDVLNIVDLEPLRFRRKVRSLDNVDHLLGLVHSLTGPIFDTNCANHANYQEEKGKFLGLYNRGMRHRQDKAFIGCTVELQRDGVLFEKAVDSDSLFDIKFEDGVMKIPPLTVDDETECLFRNLIAYEQYHQNLPEKYVTDYATLMDCLVDSERDVEQLCNYKIFQNRLANDEALSDMFNKLCCNVTINPTNFCYSELFKKVNHYRTSPSGKRGWRSYKGELRYHLRNPMTLLNLQISITTLLFAVIQIIVPLFIKS